MENVSLTTQVKRYTVNVRDFRKLTETAYIIRMDRMGMEFRAGQYITVGIPSNVNRREYSIFSNEKDDFLEILAVEVNHGMLSQELKKVKMGDKMVIEGPYGFFTIPEEKIRAKRFIFLASGTGVSPFHSMVGSYSGLDYVLLHGVRTVEDAYERKHFHPGRYILCTSRDTRGDFYGHLTEYLIKHRADLEAEYYFCGNSNMIHDAMDILESKGVSPEQFHAEVYF
jgi:ferredoxin--NADP+ reductase